MNDFLERRGFERRLEADLLDEADLFEQLGGHDLHLEEVLGRAAGIRRRRRTAGALVAAAAVAALVAPAGVLVAGHHDAAGPGPAVHPMAPASTSASPAPTGVQRLADLAAMPVGPAPATGYLDRDVWHAPDGSTWQPPAVSGGVLGVARVGDAFLVDTPSEKLAEPTAMLVQRDGTVVHHWPMSGGFAVSDDGAVIAFVKPDGTPVVVQDGGRAWHELPRIERGTGFQAVAVVGADCKESATSAGCSVFVNSTGQHPESWVSSSHGLVDRASTDITSLTDVRADGTRAGVTSYDEKAMTTCSRVEAPDGSGWRTCRNQLGSFSPDGSRILARNAIGDGLGDTMLDVLDARSGEPVVRYEVAAGGAITQVRWEDDAHVLAVVFDGRRWAILRVGLDGRAEVAVPPVKVAGADPTVSPFQLPAA